MAMINRQLIFVFILLFGLLNPTVSAKPQKTEMKTGLMRIKHLIKENEEGAFITQTKLKESILEVENYLKIHDENQTHFPELWARWNGLQLKLLALNREFDKGIEREALRLADLSDDNLAKMIVNRVVGSRELFRDKLTAMRRLYIARELANELNSLRDMASINKILGYIALDFEAYADATQHFEDSLQAAQQLPEKMPIISALISKGEALLKQQLYDEAEEAFRAADELTFSALKKNSAYTGFSLAKIAFAKGDFERAESLTKDALDFFEAEEVREDHIQAIARCYEVLTKIHLAMDRPGEALKTNEISCSLDSTELAYRIHQTRIKIALDEDSEAQQNIENVIAEIEATRSTHAKRNDPKERRVLLEHLIEAQKCLSEIFAKSESFGRAHDSQIKLRELMTENYDRSADRQRTFYTRKFQLENEGVKRTHAKINAFNKAQAEARHQRMRERFLIGFCLFGMVGTFAVFWLNRKRMMAEYASKQHAESNRLQVKYSEELEDQIAIKTKEIKEHATRRRDLEIALDRKQRDEAIGKLTSGIAHDFNNLLQVILHANESVMRDQMLGSESYDWLNQSKSAALAGREITKQLLTFAGKITINPTHVSINDYLVETQGLFATTLGDHIEMDLKLCEAAPKLYVDRALLTTAIINLCSNARDALKGTDAPKVLITATYEESEDSGAVSISVTDNGSGMSKQQLAKACEPFFSSKPIEAGVGLGLSMVKGFMNKSQGKFNLKSEIGAGSTASLVFPIAMHAELGVGIDKPNDLPSHKFVCVVEDNEFVNDVVCKAIESLGWDVKSFLNAEEAIAEMENNLTPELVIVDLQLSGMMDGERLAEWINLHHGTPILMMTGLHGTKSNFPILEKPFNKSDLSKAVQSALGISVNDTLEKSNNGQTSLVK